MYQKSMVHEDKTTTYAGAKVKRKEKRKEGRKGGRKGGRKTVIQ